jgi:hypothetical protein
VTLYLNWRGPQGRETIDEYTGSGIEARRERARLLSEYAMAGMVGAYWSSRPCANWKES